MLYLVLLTLGVFFLFWFGDFYITLKTIKINGSNIEINPILRRIFNYRRKFVYLFKIIEILIFSYLVYYITGLGGKISFNILLIFIFIYSLLVVNNAHVYSKITNQESFAFKLIFLILTLFIILFIYLNYLLYSDLNVTYNAISECNSKYISLYNTCNVSKIELPKVENILKELNLSVRG